jgi:hypothetical protein
VEIGFLSFKENLKSLLSVAGVVSNTTYRSPWRWASFPMIIKAAPGSALRSYSAASRTPA